MVVFVNLVNGQKLINFLKDVPRDSFELQERFYNISDVEYILKLLPKDFDTNKVKIGLNVHITFDEMDNAYVFTSPAIEIDIRPDGDFTLYYIVPLTNTLIDEIIEKYNPPNYYEGFRLYVESIKHLYLDFDKSLNDQ